jgi:hypothetical protein
MKTKASQEHLMKRIRRNIAAVTAMQQRTGARGVGIDREMKEIEAELKRLTQEFDRGLDPSRERHKP